MQGYTRTIHYYETDQMKVVHHSNYIRWFEEARIYYFNASNMSYPDLEALGVVSPVVEIECNYKAMMHFSEEAQIEVQFYKCTGISYQVAYQIYRKSDQTLCCTGRSKHCFVTSTGKIVNLKRQYPEIFEMLKNMEEEPLTK